MGYEFNGTFGQRITIRSSSLSYRMSIGLFDGRSGNNPVTFGDYSLTVTCVAGPPTTNCSESSTNLCLNSGRFKVEANWQTNDGKSGFAAGLTNVRVTLTVTDTKTGAVRTYFNPQNTAFQPIQDTSAFATCP